MEKLMVEETEAEQAALLGKRVAKKVARGLATGEEAKTHTHSPRIVLGPGGAFKVELNGSVKAGGPAPWSTASKPQVRIRQGNEGAPWQVQVRVQTDGSEPPSLPQAAEALPPPPPPPPKPPPPPPQPPPQQQPEGYTSSGGHPPRSPEAATDKRLALRSFGWTAGRAGVPAARSPRARAQASARTTAVSAAAAAAATSTAAAAAADAAAVAKAADAAAAAAKKRRRRVPPRRPSSASPEKAEAEAIHTIVAFALAVADAAAE